MNMKAHSLEITAIMDCNADGERVVVTCATAHGPVRIIMQHKHAERIGAATRKNGGTNGRNGGAK